jgi:hypothetical protein
MVAAVEIAIMMVAVVLVVDLEVILQGVVLEVI